MSLHVLQLRKWIDAKPADFAEDEDPPLIDQGSALPFFAATANAVKAELGEAKVLES